MCQSKRTLMANHIDIGTPALPVQNWNKVIGRIEGVHESEHLPIWRPSQAQREDHRDEALLERRLNGFDLFPVLDAPYLHTSHPILVPINTLWHRANPEYCEGL